MREYYRRKYAKKYSTFSIITFQHFIHRFCILSTQHYIVKHWNVEIIEILNEYEQRYARLILDECNALQAYCNILENPFVSSNKRLLYITSASHYNNTLCSYTELFMLMILSADFFFIFFSIVVFSKFNDGDDDGDSCIVSLYVFSICQHHSLQLLRYAANHSLSKWKHYPRNSVPFLSQLDECSERIEWNALCVLVVLSSGLRNIFVCLFYIHVLRHTCFLPRLCCKRIVVFRIVFFIWSVVVWTRKIGFMFTVDSTLIVRIKVNCLG